VYSEDARGPGDGCKQYFLNYSNPEAFAYALEESEQGALATGSPFVDGTFLDDSQAIPQEHPLAPGNMGLTPLQLATLQNDTHRFVQTAIETLAGMGFSARAASAALRASGGSLEAAVDWLFGSADPEAAAEAFFAAAAAAPAAPAAAATAAAPLDDGPGEYTLVVRARAVTHCVM
jgi:hypothetical protein